MVIVIGLIVCIVGAVLVGAVIVHAAPRLANLPQKHPPADARESALKERLLLDRLTRRVRDVGMRIARRTRTSSAGWGVGLQRGYRRLRLLAQEYAHQPSSGTEATSCEERMNVATTAMEEGSYDLAEEQLLACLKVDAKHRGAYLRLSDLYRLRKEDALAEETLRFLRKLYPDDLDVIGEFAEVLAERGKHAVALKEIQAALAVAPRNPRYLDFAVEAAMVLRKGTLAKEYLTRLREVNPENQKLEVFTERIAKLM